MTELAARSAPEGTAGPTLARVEVAEILWLGGLALLCLVGYWPALGGEFLLDDYVVLFGDRGVETKSLFDLFLGPQHAFYRPVGHLFLWCCSRIFGSHPWPYHAANLALLILIVWLVFRLCRAVGLETRAAGFGAALFALHPFQAFLVDYVTASVIAFYLLFLLAASLLLADHLRSGRRRTLLLGLLAFGAALLSHEAAVTFPLVVYGLCRWVASTSRRRALSLASLYGLVALCFLWLRSALLPLGAGLRGALTLAVEPREFVATLGDLTGWYLRKLAWPRDVLFLWSDAVERRHWPWKALFLAVIVGATAVLLVRWRGSQRSFALLLFASGGLMVPLAGLTYYPVLEPIIEPHWLYFSSIGFFILVALAADSLWRRRGPLLAGLVGAGVLSLLLVLLWQAHRPWRNEIAYCEYWLSLNDLNWTPYDGLGRAYLRRGDAPAAVAILREAERKFTVPTILRQDLRRAERLAGEPPTAGTRPRQPIQ